MNRALHTLIAQRLHAQQVGYYTGGAIPPGTAWPIYFYRWGKSEQQLVVNLPVWQTSPLGTFNASLQVLARAITDLPATSQLEQAVNALDGATYLTDGQLSISKITHTTTIPLGLDENQRPMWVAKFNIHGRINRKDN